MSNKRNYSQRSNYMAGTTGILEILPFYLQSINIPGINFSLPEIGGRTGVRLNMTADNMSFNGLSCEIIMDEDYQIYKDIMKIVSDHYNVESGSFADYNFDFWQTMTDDMGRIVMKLEYYNCRIESIGDISLEVTDEVTEHTFSMDLKFDYFKIVDTVDLPTLADVSP